MIKIKKNYWGRDKITKWQKMQPSLNVRTRRHNTVKHLPGVIGLAKEAKEVIDCWNLFFTDEIIQNIVGYTNIYIEKMSSHYKDPSDCRSTSVHEIGALISMEGE